MHMIIKQKGKETTETCIPILVVDEDIYKWCPSLLISTIDKFAQISWRENISSLFGKYHLALNADSSVIKATLSFIIDGARPGPVGKAQ